MPYRIETCTNYLIRDIATPAKPWYQSWRSYNRKVYSIQQYNDNNIALAKANGKWVDAGFHVYDVADYARMFVDANLRSGPAIKYRIVDIDTMEEVR